MKGIKNGILCVAILATGYTYGQQQAALYQKAADACDEAIRQYKAKGCQASAAYVEKIKAWNVCMVKALAGGPPCGEMPSYANAPKCEAAAVGGMGSSPGSSSGVGANHQSNNIFSSSLADAGSYGEQALIQSTMTSAYENALSSGKRESGAMLEAFVTGAQIASDANMAATTLGVGAVVSGLMYLGERKAEKRAAEEERIRIEEEKRQKREAEWRLIDAKNSFARELEKTYFVPAFSQFVRKGVVVIYPVNMTAQMQDIYISEPVFVNAYEDGSFPLKEKVHKKILSALPDALKNDGFVFELFYPIKTDNNFIQILQQIGAACSGLNINPKMFSVPYKNETPVSNSANTTETDFWGTPAKKTSPISGEKETQQKKNDFWNN